MVTIERYGFEAKKILGHDIPCIIVIENMAFGNAVEMTRTAKKVKGEYKQHYSKLTVPITHSYTDEGHAFTTGLASLKTKNLHIGIFSTFIGQEMKPVSFVAVPANQRKQYLSFKTKLIQTAGKLPRLKKNNAWIIGSNINTNFEIKTNLEMVVNDQKQEIVTSIENFFLNTKPYDDLGLPPFRKICFAGPPGTGKTMMAGGIAKFLSDKYNIKTMYVSGGGQFGSSFDLIKIALDLIQNHASPTLLIVEEFESFVLNMQDRAKILTFLDGFETPDLKYPLCLIATTNHPELMDPAIINRTGRINRIFWFKCIKNVEQANGLISIYNKGSLDHLPDFGNLLVNKTQDFVKELLIELKLNKAIGTELSISNISDIIRKMSSRHTNSEAQGMEFN
jgi:AAA+ superfamily predicted ATPase